MYTYIHRLIHSYTSVHVYVMVSRQVFVKCTDDEWMSECASEAPEKPAFSPLSSISEHYTVAEVFTEHHRCGAPSICVCVRTKTLCQIILHRLGLHIRTLTLTHAFSCRSMQSRTQSPAITNNKTLVLRPHICRSSQNQIKQQP